MESLDHLARNKLDENSINLISSINGKIINSIKQSLSLSKNIKDSAYVIFEQELKNYTKNNTGNLINSIISRPYLLIPFNLEDTVQGNWPK